MACFVHLIDLWSNRSRQSQNSTRAWLVRFHHVNRNHSTHHTCNCYCPNSQQTRPKKNTKRKFSFSLFASLLSFFFYCSQQFFYLQLHFVFWWFIIIFRDMANEVFERFYGSQSRVYVQQATTDEPWNSLAPYARRPRHAVKCKSRNEVSGWRNCTLIATFVRMHAIAERCDTSIVRVLDAAEEKNQRQ